MEDMPSNKDPNIGSVPRSKNEITVDALNNVARELKELAIVEQRLSASQQELTAAQWEQVKALKRIQRFEGYLLLVTLGVIFATAWLGWTTKQQADATRASIGTMAQTNANIEKITAAIQSLVGVKETEISREPVALSLRKEGGRQWFALNSSGSPISSVGLISLPRIYVKLQNPGRIEVTAIARLFIAGKTCNSDQVTLPPEQVREVTIRLDHRDCRIPLPVEPADMRLSVESYDFSNS